MSWHRVKMGYTTRYGTTRRAHWIVEGGAICAICGITGTPTNPGIAPHCQTCLRKRAQLTAPQPASQQ